MEDSSEIIDAPSTTRAVSARVEAGLFALVNRTPWFRPVFERFEANLKALDESYPDWKGRDVFNSLQLTCEALLNAGGMFYRRYPLGGYFIALTRPPE